MKCLMAGLLGLMIVNAAALPVRADDVSTVQVEFRDGDPCWYGQSLAFRYIVHARAGSTVSAEFKAGLTGGLHDAPQDEIYHDSTMARIDGGDSSFLRAGRYEEAMVYVVPATGVYQITIADASPAADSYGQTVRAAICLTSPKRAVQPQATVRRNPMKGQRRPSQRDF